MVVARFSIEITFFSFWHFLWLFPYIYSVRLCDSSGSSYLLVCAYMPNDPGQSSFGDYIWLLLVQWKGLLSLISVMMLLLLVIWMSVLIVVGTVLDCHMIVISVCLWLGVLFSSELYIWTGWLSCSFLDRPHFVLTRCLFSCYWDPCGTLWLSSSDHFPLFFKINLQPLSLHPSPPCVDCSVYSD